LKGVKERPALHIFLLCSLSTKQRLEWLTTLPQGIVDKRVILPLKPRLLFKALERVLQKENMTRKVDSSADLAAFAPLSASLQKSADVKQRTGASVLSTAVAAKYPLSVLVAEDNETNRKVIGFILVKLGYAPDFAVDGREAYEMVTGTQLVMSDTPKETIQKVQTTHPSVAQLRNGSRASKYDLTLMDLQMPRLDGLMATRLIRAALGDDQPPYIVALTANAMSGDRERCIEAGMNDYTSKPVKPLSLIDQLAKAHAMVKQRSDSGTSNVCA